jgi:hypothetical protein
LMNKLVTTCLLLMISTTQTKDADLSVFKSIYAAQDVSLDTKP